MAETRRTETRRTETRKARAFGAKLMKAMAVCAAPGLLAIAAGVFGWLSWWVATPLFLASVLTAIFVSFRVMASFRCGVCGQPVDLPPHWYAAPDGEPILFTCRECGVSWDVGLSGAGD